MKNFICIFVLSLLLYSVAYSATLKDVHFSCKSNVCDLEFDFEEGSGLPQYFQKYDNSKNILRIAFAKTFASFKSGRHVIDESSAWLRHFEVSRDASKDLLYLDFKCGNAIMGDKNPVGLRNKSVYVFNFTSSGKKDAASWNLVKAKSTKQTKQAKIALPKEEPIIRDFSIMPPNIASVSIQKNSEWEELMIVLGSDLPKNLAPVLTDSIVELSVPKGPEHSPVFQTANCGFAKGFAWTNGKLTIYLHRGAKPAVMLMNNRLLLQAETNPGRLDNWQAFPTGLKKSAYFLPSYEHLAAAPNEFARVFDKKRSQDLSLVQTIQVKRSDASYIVTEDIASLFPGPSEGRPLEALEFGDRLKVLTKQAPFYKVRYKNKEGYVYQRDVLQEAELTTSQRDRLRRLKKEDPGGVDNVAAAFGWKDDDKIIYSSYGFRDPFIEVRSSANDGINIDNLTLVGVIYENKMPMAILSDNKSRGQSYTLYEGDTVKNGKILKISESSVLFLLQEYGVSRRYTMSLPNKFGGDK